jgi:GNAT superfamily N-acetyltransferase
MNPVEELGEDWDERIAELLCLLNPYLDPNPQTATRWIRGERRRGRRYFGIVEGDRILSIASVAPFEGKCWKVGMIYTVPERRGEGLATSVLSRAVQEAFKAGAEKVIAFVHEERGCHEGISKGGVRGGEGEGRHRQSREGTPVILTVFLCFVGKISG